MPTIDFLVYVIFMLVSSSAIPQLRPFDYTSYV